MQLFFTKYALKNCLFQQKAILLQAASLLQMVLNFYEFNMKSMFFYMKITIISLNSFRAAVFIIC